MVSRFLDVPTIQYFFHIQNCRLHCAFWAIRIFQYVSTFLPAYSRIVLEVRQGPFKNESLKIIGANYVQTTCPSCCPDHSVKALRATQKHWEFQYWNFSSIGPHPGPLTDFWGRIGSLLPCYQPYTTRQLTLTIILTLTLALNTNSNHIPMDPK